MRVTSRPGRGGAGSALQHPALRAGGDVVDVADRVDQRGFAAHADVEPTPTGRPGSAAGHGESGHLPASVPGTDTRLIGSRAPAAPNPSAHHYPTVSRSPHRHHPCRSRSGTRRPDRGTWHTGLPGRSVPGLPSPRPKQAKRTPHRRPLAPIVQRDGPVARGARRRDPRVAMTRNCR